MLGFFGRLITFSIFQVNLGHEMRSDESEHRQFEMSSGQMCPLFNRRAQNPKHREEARILKKQRSKQIDCVPAFTVRRVTIAHPST